MELWRKFINFEKQNPLRSEDTALVSRRVMFATEQCLLVLSHHPDVWIMAAQYLDQTAKTLTEKAVCILSLGESPASFNCTKVSFQLTSDLIQVICDILRLKKFAINSSYDGTHCSTRNRLYFLFKLEEQ